VEWVSDFVQWFSGGSDSPYMTLYHCMNEDNLWVAITVILDLAIAAGYILIARHWWVNQKSLHNPQAREALGRMRNIFVFCGLCGYLFIPIKMFWPAWRLYDLFLIVLAYQTWRYAWGARDLKVIYSELHRTERLAQDLEDSRAESRRKTRFLNAISHDLKNPIYGLSLQARAAARSLERSQVDNTREAIDSIEKSTASLVSLLQNLLELGQLDWSDDPVESQTFSIAESVNNVTNMLRSLADEKGLRLIADVEPSLHVETDRAMFERIATNLIANAIQYTAKGSVRIRATHRQKDLILEVVDTGPGIPEDAKAHIFDEFFQLDNRARDARKGVGLGLTITSRLVEKLQGDIVVESEIGHGSTFRVTIPHVVRGPSTSAGLAAAN
jgi:signal transduction histidine kinase